MDKNTALTQLSELKVMADLASKDYHIFNQVSGKAPFDIVILKDGNLQKVSIKGTSSLPNTVGKYQIDLRRIRSNRNTNVIYKLCEDEFDLLAVYIEYEDSIRYLEFKDITGRSTVNI